MTSCVIINAPELWLPLFIGPLSEAETWYDVNRGQPWCPCWLPWGSFRRWLNSPASRRTEPSPSTPVLRRLIGAVFGSSSIVIVRQKERRLQGLQGPWSSITLGRMCPPTGIAIQGFPWRTVRHPFSVLVLVFQDSSRLAGLLHHLSQRATPLVGLRHPARSSPACSPLGWCRPTHFDAFEGLRPRHLATTCHHQRTAKPDPCHRTLVWTVPQHRTPPQLSSPSLHLLPLRLDRTQTYFRGAPPGWGPLPATPTFTNPPKPPHTKEMQAGLLPFQHNPLCFS